jgi:hypothetical protein
MPLNDVIENVPQGETEGIARRLLGDDIVSRYGDVIGARKAGMADVLRDFTLGFTKGQGAVDALHLKVQDQFSQQYHQAATTAAAEKKIDVDKAKAALKALKDVQGLPPGNRVAVLKDTYDALGITNMTTPLKMFADSDILAQLPMDKLEKAAAEGTLSTAQMSAVFGDASKATQFINEAARRKRDEAQTGNAILAAERTALSMKRDKLKLAEEKARHPLSIKDAQLRSENLTLQNKAIEAKLAKGASGGALGALLSGKGLGLPAQQAPAPVSTSPKLAEPGVVPLAPPDPMAGTGSSALAPAASPDAVAAIKAKYGLK